MSFVTPIRPGGVVTPGSPITIITVPPGGTPPEPPPSAPDIYTGATTTFDFVSGLAQTSRTPIYQVVIARALSSANAYWTLDEALGTIRLDSAGSNDLVSFNAAVGQSTGHLATAAQFTASSAHYLGVSSPSPALRHFGRSFSVTCWVYLDSKTTDMGICGQYGTSAAARSWLLQYRQSVDKFRFLVNNGAGTEQSVTADLLGSPSAGTWYFIEATYENLVGSANLYISVNGLRSTAASTEPPSQTTQAFEVGRANGTDYFDGRIDELKFFKRALTTDEREAIYTDSQRTGTSYEFSSSWPQQRDPIGREVLIPVSLEQRADIEQCRFPLSTLVFALVSDSAGEVRRAVTEGLEGITVDFYLGFWDLPWEANKRLRFHGVITEVEQQSGVYQITARSLMSVANDVQVFDGAQTRLTASITDIATTLNVASTAAFAEPNADINLSYPVVIENEFLFPLGRTATTFTSVQRVGAVIYAIPPEMPGSTSVAHASGSRVTELVNLGPLTGTNSDSGTNDLHPMDLLSDFLLGSEEKASLNSALVTASQSSLDIAKTTLGTSLKFSFLLNEAINAKAFAEREFFLCVGGYPVENAAGALGIKLYQGGSSATVVDTITDNDILDFPHWLRNAEKIVNSIVVAYDYDPIAKTYTQFFPYTDPASIAAYGERSLLIASKGIRSAYTQTAPTVLTWFTATAAFLTDMCERVVARFGGRSPVISVTTTLAKQLLQVGQDVEITVSHIPDIDTGEIGLTNRMAEIQAIHQDFIGNKIELELCLYPIA